MSECLQWLYGFQAAYIQGWILRSNRLRDIQGASSLLEELCKEHFTACLKMMGPHEVLSQNAGAARVLFHEEADAKLLHLSWPLVADHLAPGLTIQQALVPLHGESIVDAQQELGRRLHSCRNTLTVSLPTGTPPMRRNPRTGLPAVSMHSSEPLDREILARRREWEALQGEKRNQGSRLEQRFLGSLASEYEFESGAEEEGGALAEGYVGVIHADGNDVGRVASSIVDPAKFREFSRGLAIATERAAVRAIRNLVGKSRDGRRGKRILPARPVLLGGDDVTIIVAERCATRFAQDYLEGFESEARTPDGHPITACCGIALVKSHFPYDRAHELAESLCQQAKRRARARASATSVTPSAMACHRVTTSLTGSAESVLANELTASGVRLTLEAYGVGHHAAGIMPTFEQLRGLVGALEQLPRGKLRELVDALYLDKTSALLEWKRFREVNRGRLDPLDSALCALSVTKGSFLVPGAGGMQESTPLLDALRLVGSEAAGLPGRASEGTLGGAR